ncbi:3851_t:CDS:2 [Funneliformis caledonium]|uniref:3851_t:CDS:1 n=1 Tax=Funneliformis caledonium TaxID=1117310 RepID=A0A9N9GE20_9GLOM|nr:3851_t:CDS:2 [Funneliformis caledonium]
MFKYFKKYDNTRFSYITKTINSILPSDLDEEYDNLAEEVLFTILQLIL